MEILCFFAGIVFYYTKSIFALCFIFVSLLFGARKFICLWFLVAYLWAFIHNLFIFDTSLVNYAAKSHVKLLGEIISIPSSKNTKTEFEFKLKSIDGKPLKAKILLSCYNQCPLFKYGQVWLFEAKLKVANYYANPGSFNYKTWLLAKHIQFLGYIKVSQSFLLKEKLQNLSPLAWREKLAAKLERAILDRETSSIVQALTLGLGTNISKENWDLFRRTGTTHLLVISGSHIALIAGFIFLLVRFLWTRQPLLCLYIPAGQVAALASIFAAFSYCLLSGMAVPAQRALVACIMLLLPNFLSFRFSGWQAWRYALLLVLVIEPHVVLMPGFYLSFIAVAILIAVNQRYSFHGFKKIIIMQLACLVGLLPFTLFWYSYGALNGFFANFLAIPLVGYVIVPLALLALIGCNFFSISYLAIILKQAIHLLLGYLKWINSFADFNLSFPLHDISSLLAISLALIIPLFLPLRIFILPSLLLGVSAFFKAYPSVKANDAEIYVLDVGQGLAVVIRTQAHILIYDTGMKFYQGSDIGQMVIAPFLSTLGVAVLDKIVISHPDLDHRGGLAFLEKTYPLTELVVDKVKYYKRGASCHHHPPWNWDGVNFQFFSIKKQFRDKNNSSCILKVWSSQGSVLLPGDIEKLAEGYLSSKYAKKLASQVLIVAHHGSKTSSTSEFIKQVSPSYAIISAGLDNRYHFPHPETLSTLKKEKIKVLNTASCGMASFNLNSLSKGINCFKKL